MSTPIPPPPNIPDRMPRPGWVTTHPSVNGTRTITDPEWLAANVPWPDAVVTSVTFRPARKIDPDPDRCPCGKLWADHR